MIPTPPTINLVHLSRVTSTMDVLDELIAAGAPEWTVVLADEQTAGRGRSGRSWEAAAGSSLLCSILVRPRFPPEQTGMLSIAVGVALAEYLETLSVPVALKWPNDVLLDGRKLGGVLIRTRRDPSAFVSNVGIGLNLMGSPMQVDDRASLDEVTDRLPTTTAIVARLAAHLAMTLIGVDTSAIREAWWSRAAMAGELVTVEDGARTHAGRLVGIDDRGALELQGNDGQPRAIVAGDLVRGPRVEAGRRPTYTHPIR